MIDHVMGLTLIICIFPSTDHRPIAICNKSRGHVQQLEITLRVSRRYQSYLYNMLLYLCVLSTFSLTSYSIPLNNFADRCSITVTMLLTLVAFLLVVKENTPVVPYLTLLDQYVMACFSVLLLIWGQQAVCAAFTEHWTDDDPENAYARPRITNSQPWSMDSTLVFEKSVSLFCPLLLLLCLSSSLCRILTMLHL